MDAAPGPGSRRGRRGPGRALTEDAIVAVLREAAEGAGLPADVVQLVPGEGHEPAKVLMRPRAGSARRPARGPA